MTGKLRWTFKIRVDSWLEQNKRHTLCVINHVCFTCVTIWDRFLLTDIEVLLSCARHLLIALQSLLCFMSSCHSPHQLHMVLLTSLFLCFSVAFIVQMGVEASLSWPSPQSMCAQFMCIWGVWIFKSFLLLINLSTQCDSASSICTWNPTSIFVFLAGGATINAKIYI